MCGLFGLQSTSLSGVEIDTFREIGTLSSFRGRDSTGIATVSRGKKNQVCFKNHKFPTNPVSFLYHPVIEKTISDLRPYVIAGHCRWATLGDVNKTNAHPFLEGSIIGMHNGTVEAFAPDKDKLAEESDSMNLFRFMAKEGAVEAIKKGKDGAMALVWIDIGKKTINFYRNIKRPLYWSVTTGRTMFWASEAMFLDIANRRSTITFETPKIFDVDKIYTFHLGGITPSNVHDLSEVLRPKSTFHFRSRQSSAPWEDWEGDFSTDMAKAWELYDNGADAPLQLPAPPGSTDTQIYIGYGGTAYSVAAAKQALNCGCGMCGSVKDVSDQVAWLSHTDYICDDCINSPLVEEYGNKNLTVSRLVDKETSDEN